MKEREATYEELEDKLGFYVQTLNDTQSLSDIGSWDWNVLTNQIQWSDMMYIILGLKPGELEPSYDLALSHVHDDDKEQYEQALLVSVENQTPYYVENRIKKADNSIVSVISRGKCFMDEKGNTIRMIGTVQDISVQKNTELVVKENLLKSAFLANMSHEVRTPLNAILGFSSLLKDQNLSKVKRDKYLEFIESGGNRLMRMIADVLDVSKIDSNQLTLNREPCNLNELLNNLCDEFETQSLNAECKMTLDTGLDDHESIVLTDQSRLIQILSNLITNCFKYAKKGNILIGYKKVDTTLTFFVKDNGSGIDPKYHKSIFERFSQVDKDYANSESGVGLGLAIVKELLELMKGEIWLESDIGIGSTFNFTIPYLVNDTNNIKLADKTPDLMENNEISILIAEDEFINFCYFEAVLEKHLFKIIHAKNGEKAIELFNENDDVSLVLMDINMPKINGEEAMLKIKEKDKNIPIIAMTAYAMKEDKKNLINAGFTDYISKPVSEEELITMVKKHLKFADQNLILQDK